MTQDVLTLIESGVGRIRLNRPKAIHALTPEMVDIIIDALIAWRTDDSIVAVMIDHAPAPDGDPKLSRGFCAGGDIALIANSAKTDCVVAEDFFLREYRMNHLLFVYDKPIVVFMDGITMGGGVGIAAPAPYRVATERTMFAMPETGIGLFPDVGGGWFLSRLPGRVGYWLAATGARIDGADALSIGMASHYMPGDTLDTVKAQIIADPANIESILDAAQHTPPLAKLDAQRADIDRLFAADRYEDILAALTADGDEWAQKQLSTLATKSPQTVKVALRQLVEGAQCTDFADNMRNEYRISHHVIRRPDFVEGVRAVIFDKDNAPQWNPATPEAVTDALIDSLFAPLPPEKEWTPLTELDPGQVELPESSAPELGETSSMSYETILVEQHDAVTLIMLNRPHALNALNGQVLKDLIVAFAAYDADPTQRCAVLTGNEKAFAAGADIKEMAEKPAADFYLEDFFSDWTSKIVTTRKPWIAAVAGFALGGGCELAMMADFIIAADNAQFGQPEIKLGVAPGMGGSQRLTRAVGKAKAMDMCLTGRRMDAAEAERASLVSRVVPAADLLEEALKAAAIIAGMPMMAAMVNKEMVNIAFETGLNQGLLTERRLFQILTATEDKTEGMAAFVEKRPGAWKGR